MTIYDLLDRSYESAAAKGFHDRPREFGTALMLIVSELAEALEAHRIGDREGVREEMSDVFIRLGDTCAEFAIDVVTGIPEKMAINESRPHLHGKLY